MLTSKAASDSQIAIEDPIKVLLVDDDAVFLEISKQVLLEMDNRLTIECATNVDEGVRRISAEPFDIVVSDFEMPIKTGLDFLKILHQLRIATPFILFTGRGREEVAIQALNLGAEGYFNKQGSPETVYGELLHGIKKATKHKRAQEALKVSQAKFALAFKNGPTAITITRLCDGKVLDANDEIVDILGYLPIDVKGKSTLELNIWGNSAERKTFLDELMLKGAAQNVELQLRKKSGEPVWVNISASSIEVEGEQCIISSFISIEGNRKTLAELTNARDDWERTFDSVPDLIFVLDKEHRITRINGAMAQKLGVLKEQVVGKTCFECVHQTSEPPSFCPHSQTILDGEEHTVEAYEPLLGGYFVVTTTPIKDAQGNILGSVHVARDVTEQKKTQDELAKSETKYRLIADNSQDVIWTMNLEGKFTFVSPSVYQLRGYTPQEVLNQTITDALTPASAQLIIDGMQRFFQTGEIPAKSFQLEQPCKNGSTVWTEVNFTVLRSQNGDPEGVLGISRNISARQEQERALRKSEERFRVLAESLPEIVFETDIKGKLTYVNRKAFQISGYTQGDFESGMYNTHFFAPEILEKAQKNFLEAMSNGTSTENEYIFVRKDGSRFPAIVEGIPIKEDGVTVGMRGIIIDLSEREKAKEKIECINEKLRVVGSLTRHDVANKLMGAKGNVYLLKKEVKDNPKLLGFVEGIERSINQCANILEFSRLYERVGVEALTPTDVEAAFSSATKLVSLQGIAVENQTHGLTVLADSMLAQLFYNLLENSVKHGGKVSKIRLSYKVEGGVTRIFYEDNGRGVESENKRRIFDGFTTGGSGLGLKLVKRMIESYGWTISEVGVEGSGVRFEVVVGVGVGGCTCGHSQRT